MSSTGRPTRIVFVIAALVIGGAERQLIYLLKRLDRRQYSPHIIAFGTGQWEKYFRALDVPIEIIAYDKGRFAAIFRTSRRLSVIKPDIVHTYGRTANNIGRLAAIFSGVPVIIVGERSAPHIKSYVQLMVDRFLARFTDHLITNSVHAAEYYLDHGILPAAKVSAVRNGIEAKNYPMAKGSNSGIGLAYIGDFRHEKNHKVLLEAMALVIVELPDVQLHLAGDGPLRIEIESQIDDLGIKSNVTLHGIIEDVPVWLSKQNIYVHVAHYEGLPNAVMEAMACGLPCVVSDRPGCSELVSHQETGLVIVPGHASVLAEALLGLIKDPSTAHKYGLAGRAYIKRELSMDKMVSGTTEIYEQHIRTER